MEEDRAAVVSVLAGVRAEPQPRLHCSTLWTAWLARSGATSSTSTGKRLLKFVTGGAGLL